MNVLFERDALLVVEHLLGLPEESRAEYLTANCGDRPELQRRVDGLMASVDAAEPPPRYVVARAPRGVESGRGRQSEIHGQRSSLLNDDVKSLGPYRLLDVIGQGGMGTVYLAEQLNPKRKVALKVLNNRFLSSKGFMDRFEREAQLLGRLEHPGIARIYDAGAATVRGQLTPFIAMEFVDGESIRGYVSRACLGLTEKLTLIAKIADAVHAAHIQFVVHRDLKPSNILITKAGEPKVLDFGIAASTESGVEHAEWAQVGELLGTLAYMSPEQARGDKDAIDVRSDVYSLGLVAFEILAGEPAFDVSASLIDIVVRGLGRGEPPALDEVAPSVPRDVAAIVAKACGEEPLARYDGAAALASDIRSYLACRPVSARPLSRGYRLRRFIQRNRVAVAALVVVNGLVVAAYARESQLKRRALGEAARTEQLEEHRLSALMSVDVPAMAQQLREALMQRTIASFEEDPDFELQAIDLERVFAGVNFESLSLQVLNKQIFEHSIRMIDQRLGERPLDQADLLQTIATAQRELRLTAEAVDTQARVLKLLSQTPDASPKKALHARLEMGLLQVKRRKSAEATRLFGEALADCQREFGSEARLTLRATSYLARSLSESDQLDQALALQEEALKSQSRLLGERDPETLESMNIVAGMLFKKMEIVRARQLLEKALDLRQSVYGDENKETLKIKGNHALLVFHGGSRREGMKRLENVLEVQERLLGRWHPHSLKSALNLSRMHRVEGNEGIARAILSVALVSARRSLDRDDPMIEALESALKDIDQREDEVSTAGTAR